MNDLVNVFDLRKKEKLYYILPSEYELDKSLTNKELVRAAIMVYLYYEDMLEQEIKYINNIPEEIDTYIISSKNTVLEYLKDNVNRKSEINYILKENRGRDISALLVTCSRYIQNYDYVCFVHDKKEHQNKCRIEDTRLWVKNMWTNTIASGEYIKNVIKIFSDKADIGVLTIPEPIGKYFDTWMGQGWYGSFDVTLELAESLKLQCDISKDKPPVSIGSTFWFRTAALHKLFIKGWKYSDFNDELLNVGNYISYAIERIFPYVAQDAGYKTGTVMSTSYAIEQTVRTQDVAISITECLKTCFGISTQYEATILRKNYEIFIGVINTYQIIYIYGAGKWGKMCLKLLRILNYEPKGFLTSVETDEKYVEGIPVYVIDEKIEKDAFVIISVSDSKKVKAMIDVVNELKLNNYFSFWEDYQL